MYYEFMPGSIPVSDHCDVLVVGGGTAGASAGISAARMHANTLVIEQYGSLGGSQTHALVTPVMHTGIAGNPLSSAISEEIITRLRLMGGANDNDKGYFDTTALAVTLEDLLLESGCRLLYHTTVIGVMRIGRRVTHAVILNTDGVSAIEAKTFIDATADAALSLMAGANVIAGDVNGRNQAVSLRFIMENVDQDAFCDYLRSIGQNNTRNYPSMHAASVEGSGRFKLEPVFHKAYEDGLLTEQDIRYFQVFSLPGRPRAVAFNCPELGARVNVLEPHYMTKCMTEGRKAIRRLVRFLRERVPGFAEAYVCEIADMLGVRESRRVVSERDLTVRDIAAYQKFEDGITTSNYPVDVHGGGDEGLEYADVPTRERYYEVPFRALIAKDLDNLFVAGRCIGADFIAQSSVRVQASCRSTGEAAGIGAAIAASENLRACEVNGVRVRNIMLGRGAEFVCKEEV